MSDAPTPQTPTTASNGDSSHTSTGASGTSTGSANTSNAVSETGNDRTARDSRDGLDAIAEIPAGRRTTGNRELIRIEAELVADGRDLDNPAVPAESIRAEVVAELEQKDLPKAWVVCRGAGE